MARLTDKQVDLLIDRLVRRVDEMNTLYLSSIGDSLKRLKNLTPTQAHELIQILKYGGTYEEIIQKIKKITGMNLKDIDSIFSNYAKQDQLFYKKFYEYKNIPFTPIEENRALLNQTKALTRMAKNEMYNFARDNVLGYTIHDVDGKVKFFGLRATYNKVLDTALLNVGQGKETFDEGMKRIMTELGQSGLKTLNYEKGRAIRLDSAVRMHLKGRLIELHNENQKMIGEEFGADGVEITVHENPAPDHEEVQGRQFSTKRKKGQHKSEWDKLQDGEYAQDTKGTTYTLDHDHKNGYRPIGEMNCYHYVFSILVGVSPPEYSDKQLRDIRKKNDEGFKWNGKHYTNYQGNQMLRRLETEIRKQKDIMTLAQESNNQELIDKTHDKLLTLKLNLKNLSSKSHLPIKKKRLQSR